MQNKWLFKDVIYLYLFIFFFNMTHYVTHLLVNVTCLGIYIKKNLFYIHFFGNNYISFHEKETFIVTVSIRFERLCYSQSNHFPCRFLLRFLIEVLSVFYRKTMSRKKEYYDVLVSILRNLLKNYVEKWLLVQHKYHKHLSHPSTHNFTLSVSKKLTIKLFIKLQRSVNLNQLNKLKLLFSWYLFFIYKLPFCNTKNFCKVL